MYANFTIDREGLLLNASEVEDLLERMERS